MRRKNCQNTSPRLTYPHYTSSYLTQYTRYYTSVDTLRRALTSSYTFLSRRSSVPWRRRKNYQNTSPQSESLRYTNSYQTQYTHYCT